MRIGDSEVILFLKVRGVIMQNVVFLILLSLVRLQDRVKRLRVDLLAGKSRVLAEGLVAAHQDVIIRSFIIKNSRTKGIDSQAYGVPHLFLLIL